jgi:hypothetical protein
MDKILSITTSLGEKIVLQIAQKLFYTRNQPFHSKNFRRNSRKESPLLPLHQPFKQVHPPWVTAAASGWI